MAYDISGFDDIGSNGRKEVEGDSRSMIRVVYHTLVIHIPLLSLILYIYIYICTYEGMIRFRYHIYVVPCRKYASRDCPGMEWRK